MTLVLEVAFGMNFKVRAPSLVDAVTESPVGLLGRLRGMQRLASTWIILDR